MYKLELHISVVVVNALRLEMNICLVQKCIAPDVSDGSECTQLEFKIWIKALNELKLELKVCNCVW